MWIKEEFSTCVYQQLMMFIEPLLCTKHCCKHCQSLTQSSQHPRNKCSHLTDEETEVQRDWATHCGHPTTGSEIRPWTWVFKPLSLLRFLDVHPQAKISAQTLSIKHSCIAEERPRTWPRGEPCALGLGSLKELVLSCREVASPSKACISEADLAVQGHLSQGQSSFA